MLMYHDISAEPAPHFRNYTVTPRALAAQLWWLSARGYTSITLDHLLAARADRSILPARPVVLTFDDGFQSCVDHAVPLLQARGFTATFYLVAGLMGQASRWLLRERGFERPLIDWTAARALLAAGFDCGSHTMSHPRLAELSAADCHMELRESRHLLANYLGREIRHFAYPFGSFNASVRQSAREAGYHSACTTQPGLSPADDDPWALHRIRVSGTDTLLDFACRLRSGGSLRDWWTRHRPSVWPRP